jgi:hypothetical protein
MDLESFTQALAQTLELPDDPAPAEADARALFAARFAGLLQRLERGRGASHGEAEALMSALGAAQVKEWELALALLEAARRPQPPGRRLPLSLGMLRRRFHFVMSMGADRTRAR